ncbi:MAG: M48 family metallopeptidase [Burkholderiaceae bacterium]|nr:M48 family metallopeptidase [Burkholderiaceae bacterium]
MTTARSVRYGDVRIAYRVTRDARRERRVRIHVEPNGSVTVCAPPGASDTDIAHAVQRRAAWIWQHMQPRLAKRQAMPRDWVSGESCRYLGRRYVLKVLVASAQCECVRLAGGQLRVTTQRREPDRVRSLVQAWYRQRAAEWLKARVAALAGSLPWVRVAPVVSFRRMRTRWGSCSPAGRLTLNPLLILASREEVDYVIIHELCHLRHHDHSPAFYRLLGRYVPRWREIKQGLDASADELFRQAG